MNLFTTYIQRNDNQHLADNLLEPCKKILSEIPNDNRYEFGKTSFYYLDVWDKIKIILKICMIIYLVMPLLIVRKWNYYK